MIRTVVLVPRIKFFGSGLFSVFQRLRKYGGDQWLLKHVIYEPYKDKILIHASYHCDRFKEENTVPFPIRRLEPHDAAYRTYEVVSDVVGTYAPCPRPAGLEAKAELRKSINS